MPTVTVLPGNDQVRIAEGETVLEGLFKAGYAYRVGCKRGGCGICKVDLVDGQITYNRTIADTVLTDEERQGSTCLSCRAVPQGDVTIALREDELRCTNPFLVLVNRARTSTGRPTQTSENSATS